MNVAKQIVFRYNGDPATEEIISRWTVTNPYLIATNKCDPNGFPR
jgi:hypothetical protein